MNAVNHPVNHDVNQPRSLLPFDAANLPRYMTDRGIVGAALNLAQDGRARGVTGQGSRGSLLLAPRQPGLTVPEHSQHHAISPVWFGLTPNPTPGSDLRKYEVWKLPFGPLILLVSCTMVLQ